MAETIDNYNSILGKNHQKLVQKKLCYHVPKLEKLLFFYRAKSAQLQMMKSPCKKTLSARIRLKCVESKQLTSSKKKPNLIRHKSIYAENPRKHSSKHANNIVSECNTYQNENLFADNLTKMKVSYNRQTYFNKRPLSM